MFHRMFRTVFVAFWTVFALLFTLDLTPPPAPWTLATWKPNPPQGSAEPKMAPRPVARVWQPRTE